MYVITMAWRCISPWSFHRSPQRRPEMDIFRYISRFPRILSKNNQKKRKPLHESFLTPVILHKHVHYHDGVTLYFSMKFPSVAPKKTRNGRFPLSEVKTTKNKKEIKKRGKLRLNNLKHWESESRNRSLSAAVLHVKPSRHNSNL